LAASHGILRHELLLFLIAEFLHMVVAAFLIVVCCFFGGWQFWCMPVPADDIISCRGRSADFVLVTK